jgi:hypothetical protein
MNVLPIYRRATSGHAWRAAEQRDEFAPLQLIELHLLPQPGTSWQHIAFEGIKSGLVAVRDHARPMT